MSRHQRRPLQIAFDARGNLLRKGKPAPPAPRRTWVVKVDGGHVPFYFVRASSYDEAVLEADRVLRIAGITDAGYTVVPE